jgi:hypothetical protein
VTDADFRQYLHDRFAYAAAGGEAEGGAHPLSGGALRRSGVLLDTALLKGGRPEAVLAAVGNWN